MPQSREEDFFSEIHQFYTLLPQNYLPLGLRAMEFTISCRLTLKMLHTKFGQDWPSNSWEDVNARWQTPTHSNRSPELLRWPENCQYGIKNQTIDHSIYIQTCDIIITKSDWSLNFMDKMDLYCMCIQILINHFNVMNNIQSKQHVKKWTESTSGLWCNT